MAFSSTVRRRRLNRRRAMPAPSTPAPERARPFSLAPVVGRTACDGEALAGLTVLLALALGDVLAEDAIALGDMLVVVGHGDGLCLPYGLLPSVVPSGLSYGLASVLPYGC